VRVRRWQLAVVFATLLLAGLFAPSVAADDKVPLGGGAGIAVNGGPPCTLAAIGHDGAGNLVGFTSAHCGGPGSNVAFGPAGDVGSVVSANDDLDYAVIKFDPRKVTPVANFDGFAINSVGPFPAFGQWVCEQSSATGNQCSYITIPNHNPAFVSVHGCRNPDDQGAPVTAGDVLVGMIVNWGPENSPPCPFYNIPGSRRFNITLDARLVSINAITDDVNAKGGPGAGFSPIPA
jgi:hypothetical protein